MEHLPRLDFQDAGAGRPAAGELTTVRREGEGEEIGLMFLWELRRLLAGTEVEQPDDRLILALVVPHGSDGENFPVRRDGRGDGVALAEAMDLVAGGGVEDAERHIRARPGHEPF